MTTNHDHDDRHDVLTQALTDLDAAPPTQLTAAEQARADAALARILDTDRTTTPAPTLPIGSRRQRRLARGVLLVAAALALTLVISMSGLIGGGTAYASWTARPAQLPIAEQEELAEQCRGYLTDPSGPETPGIPTAPDLRASELVVADTRGDWSYVVLSGADGLEATCLIEERSGFSIFPWASGTAAGSFGFVAPPPPAADRIIGTGLMATSADEGSYWSTEGHVGSDVAAVQIVTDAGTTIDATVTAGRFAAWWPERVSLGDTDGLAHVRYRITLTDGTVIGPLSYDDIGPASTG